MKVLRYSIGLVVVAAIAGAFWHLYARARSPRVAFATESAEITDIVKKTVATGSIVPRRTVEVKPKVSGVLSELYVEPGTRVAKGDPIGKITIIPDALQINQAQAALGAARIAYGTAKRELRRNEALFQRGVISESDVQKSRSDFALCRQELGAAQSTLQLVKNGATRDEGAASLLIVTATVPGTVIDVAVKEGTSVIQANNFNAGTTIAVIADLDDMVFEGSVDEAEVAKLRKDMQLAIKIGAIENVRLAGRLESISPQGRLVSGAIQFAIKAAVTLEASVEVRANYSANADVVLARKDKVLAVREALLQYADGKPFVEIEVAPQSFVQRDVTLGISDGIKVELVGGGVTVSDKIKVPANAGPGTSRS